MGLVVAVAGAMMSVGMVMTSYLEFGAARGALSGNVKREIVQGTPECQGAKARPALRGG
jgi:hypothetical protein